LAPGYRAPLHCTASGKLFLAEMPLPEREALLGRLTLTRNTSQTLCEVPTLMADLEQIRKQGYGVDNEEFVKGMVAVAVPVRNGNGQCVAAVACHAPTARYDLDALLECVDAIRHAAARVAQILATEETP
jgi:DNA-binding IclR family transcriptional regulator